MPPTRGGKAAPDEAVASGDESKARGAVPKLSREPAVVQVVILRDGLLIGTEVFLPGSYTIGSSPLADLHLDDPAIEPLHAFLYFKNLKAVIRASHRPAGFYVNGHRVTTCAIRSIDEVSCGPFLLKVRIITRNSLLPMPPQVEALLKDAVSISPGIRKIKSLTAPEAQVTVLSSRRLLSIVSETAEPPNATAGSVPPDLFSNDRGLAFYVRVHWGATLVDARCFDGRQSNLIAGPWGLPLPAEKFVLAERARRGFRFFIPPGHSIDERLGGSKYSQVCVVNPDGQIDAPHVFLGNGDGICLRAGSLLLLAHVGPRPEKSSPKPRHHRLPSLALASFLGCFVVFAAFLLLQSPPANPPPIGEETLHRLVRILAGIPKRNISNQLTPPSHAPSTSGRRRGDAHAAGGDGQSRRASTGRMEHGPTRPAIVHASGRALLVRGKMDRRAIVTVVNAHLQELRECYAQTSSRGTNLTGEALLTWTISSAGDVLKARVKSSSLANRGLEGCLLERIKTWRFPKARGFATVTYPFQFNFPPAEPSATTAKAAFSKPKNMEMLDYFSREAQLSAE